MSEEYKRAFEGKKILITGGLGFIGSTLAIRLSELNPERLVIVDSLTPKGGGNNFNIEPIKDKVDIFNIDITNKEAIDALIRGLRPDFIFSLAGLLSHTDSLKNPRKHSEINGDSQYNILEPCVSNKHKVKILYAGTRSQYGKASGSHPINEEHPTLRSADPNGISKNIGEQICIFYGDHFDNIESVSLRMTNTYGPRHQMKNPETGFLAWFIRLAMDNQDLSVFEPGTPLRDFNYVDDVIEALLMAMASEKTNGKIYNLGSCLRQIGEIKELCGNVISVKDIAEKIIEISNKIAGTHGKFSLVPYPSEAKKIEVGHIKMDFTKFYRDTGWEPKTNLNEGLEKTIKFYTENKKHYW